VVIHEDFLWFLPQLPNTNWIISDRIPGGAYLLFSYQKKDDNQPLSIYSESTSSKNLIQKETKMAKLLVHHKVQDYSAWRKVFDDHDKTRREFGSTGSQVFKSANDPNDLTVTIDWPSVDAAKAFATSDALKEAMKNAGVISQPEVTFLVEA
jgi:quinol monooxygenase YgiN